MRSTVLAAVVLTVFLAMSSQASAVDIIESQEIGGDPEPIGAGFQAGPCTADSVERRCSAKTPDLFFKQAGGHPPKGFTQVNVKGANATPPAPVGTVKTLLVDLPRGFSVNPQATPQCPKLLTDEDPPEPACAPNTQVGEIALRVQFPNSLIGITGMPIFNLVPRDGEPARFGATLPGPFASAVDPILLNSGIAWDGDYHEFFTIHVPEILVTGERGIALSARLTLDGTVGQSGAGGALLTNPTTCGNPEVEPFKRLYTTVLHADSVEEEVSGNDYDVAAPAPPSAAFLGGSEEVLSPLPKGAKPEGCALVPFEPSTSVAFAATQTDSPTGAAIDVKLPFDPAAPLYQSHVREARVTLPRGAGINPAAAQVLSACTDAQFGKGSRRPVSCPAASKVGTVSIDTPVLPPGTLNGEVFLGKQLNRDPASGDQFRLFLQAGSAARGISIRLIANTEANPATGQLTAVVREAPQLPFSAIKVKLDGGPQATLSTPPTCGPHPTSHAMKAWSGTPDNGPQDPGVTLTSAPGGKPCSATLGGRPFAPSFAALSGNAITKAFTTYALQLRRGDGDQEMKGVDLTLPPGLTAKLAGVPYCPEAAIAAAVAAAGAVEKATPSCPEPSRVGTASIGAGTGPSPLQLTGRAYLAGPYKEAPLSLVVVTPAVAGPFDLGSVVTRVALFLEPESGQIRAVSDPLPHVFGGAKAGLRSIDLSVNRPDFLLNGTNCAPLASAGALKGGGGDPANPATFSSLPVSTPYQLDGCAALEFKPKLGLKLSGGRKRNTHPALKATFTTRPADANAATASVALPKALIFDQANLGNICTRVQFAAEACPKSSIYGKAMATTPLLDQPLEGPVYLRSSDNTLPDLVAHLQGQVEIDLVARIDSFRGGIRTSFERLPDLPVSKFVLSIPGGKRRGLLAASRSLCKRPVKALVKLSGQNGKRLRQRSKLRIRCGRKPRK